MARNAALLPALLAGLAACGDLIASDDATAGATTDAATSSGGSAATELSASATSASPTSAPDASTGTSTATSEGEAGTTAAGSTAADPSCGDGVVERDELCDDGPGNADDAACTSSCRPATCGDGLVHAGVEVCDDGVNDGAYDGCLADCSAPGPRCNDGVVQDAHEACEIASHGQLCRWDCTLTECSHLPLIEPTAGTCPPAAQVNASISGDTPLGPFVGGFAAQAIDWSDARVIVVTPAYAGDSLCGQPHLLIAFDDPFGATPGDRPVHVLAVAGDALAVTAATLHLASDDYANYDASSDCAGSTLLELNVVGDGWSLSGTAEAGCCWSGDNIFVQ